MRTPRVVLGLFVLVLLPLLGAARPSSLAAQTPTPTPTPMPVREIELKATKYEFAPNKIEVALNTVVRLKVTAADRKHGFEIEGVKDSKTDIEEGTTKVIEYKATKAGTFEFKCSNFCGLGHSRMKGSIVVK